MARRASAYRPFETTDASVSNPWQLTVEAAPASFVYFGASGSSALAVPTLTLSFGLPFGFELGAGSRLLIELPDLASSQRRVVFTTNVLTLKKMFLDGSLQFPKLRGLSIGAEMNLLLPSTRTSESIGFEAILTTSHVWRSILCFHLNVAGGLSRDKRATFFSGLALEGPWVWPMRPVLELSLRYIASTGAVPAMLVGAIMPININLWIDVAGRLARTPTGQSVFELTGGINWAFPDTGFF